MRITGMRMASAALVLLGLVGLVRAEEKRQVATPAVETFTKYVRLDVELPKALRDDKSVTLHLGGGGEAGFHQAWATAEGVKVISDAVDATGLVLKDGKLKGTVEIADLRDGSEAGLAAEFTIDGTVDGGKVRGSYSGWRAVRELGTDNIEYLSDKPAVRPAEIRWSFKKKTSVKETLSGTAVDAKTAAEGQQFAKGQNWPHLRGPNDDWSAAPFKGELINDMTQARLVWKSETTPAARSQVTRYREGNIVRYLERGLAGGGASPVLADGRVYFQYFKPTGDEVSEKTVKGQIKNDRRTIVDMWKTRATDVVLCLDAATGRTLWKAEIPGGRYYPAMSGRMGSTKGWYAPQPAVADGRLYVTTTADVTHCFDAETGKLQWAKKMPMQTVRTVIDGVLLPSGNHLIACDAATGEELWRKENVNSGVRAPLHWRHKGKDYAIAGYNRGHWRDNAGGVICVEPKTGKELWRIEEGLGKNADSLYLADDTLFANIQTERKAPGQVGAFRLSAEGAEKIWELPEKYPYKAQNRPLIANDGLLLHRNGDKSGVAVIVQIATGEIVKEMQFPAGRGFLYRVGDRLILQR
ncbi:MAG: PQQ-binding-like beta-propeller repeat protein, partial [Phycisphaerae bacterium]